LLVVIAIIAVLIAILLPALGKAKRVARTALCQSNMRQIGVAANVYAERFSGRIPAFSWKGGARPLPSADVDLQFASSDPVAVRFQAVDIMRRWEPGALISASSGGSNWYAHLWFTHLVMLDELGALDARSPVVVCPEDREQLDRLEADDDEFTVHTRFRRFESSYETAAVTHSVDQAGGALDPISQHGEGIWTFSRPNRYLVSRRWSEVVFPSGKAHMFDSYDRHASNEVRFYADERSVQPILFFDGSVRISATADSNPGFRPRDPASPEPTIMRLVIPGEGTSEYVGFYRWTRGGLGGIDFGSGEIGLDRP